MPESIRSWGELIDPPHRMTSRDAVAVPVDPSFREYVTPTARRPSNSTRRANAPVRISRFGRLRAGRR